MSNHQNRGFINLVIKPFIKRLVGAYSPFLVLACSNKDGKKTGTGMHVSRPLIGRLWHRPNLGNLSWHQCGLSVQFAWNTHPFSGFCNIGSANYATSAKERVKKKPNKEISDLMFASLVFNGIHQEDIAARGRSTCPLLMFVILIVFGIYSESPRLVHSPYYRSFSARIPSYGPSGPKIPRLGRERYSNSMSLPPKPRCI